MGLFTQPPAPPQDYLNLDLFLKNPGENTADKRFRRTLAAEWFPQSGIQLTWPHAGTDWAYMIEEVNDCYVRLAYEIAIREPLLVVSPEPEQVRTALESRLPARATANIVYMCCPTNDTWARDHGFLTVIGTGGAELIDYRFNGWGGKFEAALDNDINRRLFAGGVVKGTYVDRLSFELEGGSIESDGCGTLLTTSRCLLNPNRNAGLDKGQIEMQLCDTLGIDRILWLDHGYLAGDDTDSHIDTLARLCPESTIVYVRCTDTGDEHFEELQRMEEQLRTFRTPEGEPYRLIAVPMPAAVYDEDGERLPATYANYLVMDTAVLFPTYAQPETDEQARQALQRAFPRHDIVGIDCRALIRQHGSLHCATMQFPRGVLQTGNGPV